MAYYRYDNEPSEEEYAVLAIQPEVRPWQDAWEAFVQEFSNRNVDEITNSQVQKRQDMHELLGVC